MVCSQKSLFQCEKLCGNPLTCGNHQCQSICHLVTVPRCKPGEVQKPQVMSAIENGHNYNKCNTRFGTEYLTQEQLAQTNGVAEVDTCERCNLPCQKVTLLFKVLVLGDIVMTVPCGFMVFFLGPYTMNTPWSLACTLPLPFLLSTPNNYIEEPICETWFNNLKAEGVKLRLNMALLQVVVVQIPAGACSRLMIFFKAVIAGLTWWSTY